MAIQDKRFIGIMLFVAFLLAIPLVAMQFTSEVKWTSFDFLVMGVLLGGTGILCEAVLRFVTGFRQRVALVVGILLVFLLIWAELAVGVFGTPFAGS